MMMMIDYYYCYLMCFENELAIVIIYDHFRLNIGEVYYTCGNVGTHFINIH